VEGSEFDQRAFFAAIDASGARALRGAPTRRRGHSIAGRLAAKRMVGMTTGDEDRTRLEPTASAV
jgi:hypothetical protein